LLCIHVDAFVFLYCLVLTKDQNEFKLFFQNAFRSIFLLRYTYIIFLQSNSLFLIRQSTSTNFSEFFSDFLCSLFLLICEHNLIFRCSKISYHELQILYLSFSCSIMSLENFPEFLELSEYFFGLNNYFGLF
jgi:hypothetical protein